MSPSFARDRLPQWCEKLNVTVADLLDRDLRGGRISRARASICIYLRDHQDMSWTEISEVLGGTPGSHRDAYWRWKRKR